MASTRANKKFRSQEWFDNPNNPGMTALYLERYLNQEFTREELQGEKPIIGIAQTGSDLVPCNKIHVFLNGQLMTAGTNYDYTLEGNATGATFAFDLEKLSIKS